MTERKEYIVSANRCFSVLERKRLGRVQISAKHLPAKEIEHADAMPDDISIVIHSTLDWPVFFLSYKRDCRAQQTRHSRKTI